jgi:hypothetical protein
VEESRDGLGALKLVRNRMQDYEDNVYGPADYEDNVYGPAHSYKTKLTLYNFRQKRGQDLRSLYDQFLSTAKVTIGPGRATMGLVGPRVPTVEATVPEGATAGQTRSAIAQATATMNQRIRAAALDCELATMFIYAVDKQAYQRFIIDLENEFASGRDKWPKTLHKPTPASARGNRWTGSGPGEPAQWLSSRWARKARKKARPSPMWSRRTRTTSSVAIVGRWATTRTSACEILPLEELRRRDRCYDRRARSDCC